MKTQDLVAYFRKQVSDEQQPYLWDDDEVLQYVIDAQDMFVRAMGGISVVTVPAASDPSNLQLQDLVLTPNIPLTAFSPYILRFRSAQLLTAHISIKLMDEAQVGLNRVCDPYLNEFSGFSLPPYLDDTDTGDVQGAVLGYVDNNIRWYRVPIVADSCRLHVYRLPYPRITAQESPLEIQEQHHLHLSLWMKALAYAKEDAETFDKNLADRNADAFNAYCKKASAEQDRQRFRPRIVHYGGI